jgi:hypothetical protein
MSVIQRIGDFYCFAVFDPSTKELLYSKYNFNFPKYRLDKGISNASNNTQVFHHFLTLNVTDLWEPFTVKDELKQYFSTITPEIQEYFDLYNYVLKDFNLRSLNTQVSLFRILQNQFDLIYYDYFTEIPIVCEFLHDDGDSILSKYNFDFDRYSSDFNVYGSKLSIFYDLLLRITYLSGNAISFNGFNNIPEKFKNYFFTDGSSETQLSQYLEKYSVFSPFQNVRESFENIDFDIYKTYINSNYPTVQCNTTTEAKMYYLTTGQFQQDTIIFIKENDDIIKQANKSVCTVITNNNSYGTGFLIKGPAEYDIINGIQQIYLVTCYHIIENSEKNVLYACCNYKGSTIKLQFRIIGFDRHIDICICMYDDTLPYNKAFYPEETYHIRDNLNLLDIKSHVTNFLGQKVFTLGNPSLIDNYSYMEGRIIDPKYSGSFENSEVLSYPPTILSSILATEGQSGSPLFIEENNSLICIGMITSKIGEYNQYCVAVNNNLFKSALFNGINIWINLVSKFGINDFENLRYYSQDIVPKKWLGVIFEYYNPVSTTYPELKNLPYVGGVLITNFILGFNKKTTQFVTNYDEMSETNIEKIDTPLLKSKMYNKFILSNNVAIVLKSVKVYDGINGNYKKYNLGKYDNQNGMDCITYGFIENATIRNTPNYTNLAYRKYSKLTFEYYYYTGKEWLLETETIGGNDPSWYNIYRDNSNHIYYQHKWEYPLFLVPYLEPFNPNYLNIFKKIRRGIKNVINQIESSFQKINCNACGKPLKYVKSAFKHQFVDRWRNSHPNPIDTAAGGLELGWCINPLCKHFCATREKYDSFRINEPQWNPNMILFDTHFTHYSDVPQDQIPEGMSSFSIPW